MNDVVRFFNFLSEYKISVGTVLVTISIFFYSDIVDALLFAGIAVMFCGVVTWLKNNIDG